MHQYYFFSNLFIYVYKFMQIIVEVFSHLLIFFIVIFSMLYIRHVGAYVTFSRYKHVESTLTIVSEIKITDLFIFCPVSRRLYKISKVVKTFIYRIMVLCSEIIDRDKQ